MKTIELTQGQRAILDEEDWYRLRVHKWYSMWSPATKSYYATRWVWHKGKECAVYMHREVLWLVKGDGKLTDHINHRTLDNRRCNLRVVTHRENAENRRDQSPHGVGIYFNKCKKHLSYRALIWWNGQLKHLGCYRDAPAARMARKRFLEINTQKSGMPT